MTETNVGRRRGGQGNFFAVDYGMFEEIAVLQGANAAAAYLILARGTGADNVTTSWSVQAIASHAGLGVKKAKDALNRLIDSGHVTLLASPRTHPRYRLSCADEDHMIPVWLPNELIDGRGGGTTPIRQLRQSQNANMMRELLWLYRHHDLANEGGIPTSDLSGMYALKEIKRVDGWTVFGFGDEVGWVVSNKIRVPLLCPYADDPAAAERVLFNDVLNSLLTLGLVEFVPHVFESTDEGAMPIFAYGSDHVGWEWERVLGEKAHEAGRRCLSASERREAEQAGLRHLLPLPNYLASATVRGVARLTIMPMTKLTSVWCGQSRSAFEEWEPKFDALLFDQAARKRRQEAA